MNEKTYDGLSGLAIGMGIQIPATMLLVWGAGSNNDGLTAIGGLASFVAVLFITISLFLLGIGFRDLADRAGKASAEPATD